MPAIQIVCVGQQRWSRIRAVPFAVARDGGRRRPPHRASRFRRDRNSREGCVYHLGCPHLRGRRTGPLEAYDLLSDNCRRQWPAVTFLEFDRMYLPALQRLLATLLSRSPAGCVLFSSDYQFSPNPARRNKTVPLPEFWRLHRTKRLRFNTVYPIVPAETRSSLR